MADVDDGIDLDDDFVRDTTWVVRVRNVTSLCARSLLRAACAAYSTSLASTCRRLRRYDDGAVTTCCVMRV
jgi:hypothetical protein